LHMYIQVNTDHLEKYCGYA